MVLSACAGDGLSPFSEAAQSPLLEKTPIPLYRPAGVDQIPTTDPRIYLANLDSRIDALSGRAVARPGETVRAALAAALLHRHEIRGDGNDLARAQRLLAEPPPDGPEAWLLTAMIDTRRHRFDDALHAADRAAQAGAEAHRVQAIVDQVRFASVPVPSPVVAAETDPSLTALALEGIRLLEEGRPAEATRRFAQAERVYGDVNPLPLAWLHVQQGIVYLRYRQLEPARAFFEAAHHRLPAYYLAAEHLAEAEAALGNHRRAATLYRQVVAQTGNPVFQAALAEVESALGNDAQARDHLESAERGFRAALEAHPEAVLAEAAEFARTRGDLASARELARRNLEIRQDLHSRMLLARIELELGDAAAACEVLGEALGRQPGPPELQLLRPRLHGRC